MLAVAVDYANGTARAIDPGAEEIAPWIAGEVDEPLLQALRKLIADHRSAAQYDPWQDFRPGDMIPHGGVFPGTALDDFEWNGRDWGIDDLHCVDRHCDCTDVRIVFAGTPPTEDGEPGDADAELFAGALVIELPSLAPYAIQIVNGWLASTEELKALWTDYCAGHPELGARLAARRARMKTVRPPARKPLLPREITPSRNGPCPCGSGRKYKNCCGR